MYCPNCNEEHDGKFCPECGTKLVEEPEAKINLNLGRSNAIKGDINISHIKNIVERNKTQEELILENKNRLRVLCREYLSDGIIDAQERSVIDQTASELGIDQVTLQEIIDEELLNARNSRKECLDKPSKVIFIQATKKLQNYDLDGVVNLMPKLENIESRYEDESVRFYYFLLLSALRPAECLQRYESHKEDSYWLTFWSAIAYICSGRYNSAESAKFSLGNFFSNEEDAMLIDMADAIKKQDYDTAEAFADVIEGTYSPELTNFANALEMIIHKRNELATIELPNQYKFYLEGFFAKETGLTPVGIMTPDGKLVRRNTPTVPKKQATAPVVNEEKKYEVVITAVTNQLLAMLGAKKFMGWDSELTRNNFNSLPVTAKIFDNKQKAESLLSDLTKMGMTVELKVCVESKADVPMPKIRTYVDGPSISYKVIGHFWENVLKSSKLIDFLLNETELTDEDILRLKDENKDCHIPIKTTTTLRDSKLFEEIAKNVVEEGFYVYTESFIDGVQDNNVGETDIEHEKFIVTRYPADNMLGDGIREISSGKWILPPKYNLNNILIGDTSDDMYYNLIKNRYLLFQSREGKYGLYDLDKCEFAVDCIYSDVRGPEYDDTLIYFIHNEYNIDMFVTVANKLLKRVYGYGEDEKYLTGSVVLTKTENGPAAFYNKKGNSVSDFIFNGFVFTPIDPLVIVVDKNEMVGVYDTLNCKYVLDPIYDDFESYYDDDEGNVIDEDNTVIELKHDGNTYRYDLKTRSFVQ